MLDNYQRIAQVAQPCERLEELAVVSLKTQLMIAAQIIKEIKARLNFLINVGLDYLTYIRLRIAC